MLSLSALILAYALVSGRLEANVRTAPLFLAPLAGAAHGANAAGHRRLSDFSASDLTAFKTDMCQH